MHVADPLSLSTLAKAAVLKVIPKLIEIGITKVNSNISILNLLNNLGYEGKPEPNFPSIYAYTVIHFCYGKPPAYIKLFGHDDVIKVFQELIWSEDKHGFEIELSYQVSKNRDGVIREYKEKNQSNSLPDTDIAQFVEEFHKQINHARSLSEQEHFRTSQKARDYSKANFQGIGDIKESLATFSPSFSDNRYEKLKAGLNESHSEEITDINEQIDNHQYEPAIKALERLRKHHWNNLDESNRYRLLFNLGLCNFELDQLPDAVDYMTQSVSFAENRARPLSFLAIMYCHQSNKDLEKAKRYVEKSLQVDSEDETAHLAKLHIATH